MQMDIHLMSIIIKVILPDLHGGHCSMDTKKQVINQPLILLDLVIGVILIYRREEAYQYYQHRKLGDGGLIHQLNLSCHEK